MKLIAELNKEKHAVNITCAENKIFAEIEGRNYELEVSEVEPHIFLFKHDGKVFECLVSPPNKTSGITQVRVGTTSYDVKLTDPKRLRGAGNSDVAADGIAQIITQMPGKIVRVLAEEGTEIKVGEGVIVVEAMKMQNEMKSPKDGIIKEIRFEAGATVNAGDILAVIE
jgi:biotin carboxyl carrier protein